MEPEDVTFRFLREITDDFSEERKIGEGSFGVVYKGVTRNGEDVAVKKLKLCDMNLNDKQFQTELNNLRKLEHQNIVQILGYCYETEKKPFNMPNGSKVYVEETHRALCFEYLDNGSLQKHLSDEIHGLDWHTRFKIIKGTCDGLKYIHEELEAPIYHLDLKPDNVLLDKDMVPKIADFGLSRIFDKEKNRTTPNPYGTLGYQPPEYIDRCEISGKFDIFSLGVIMIRIVAGSKGYPKCLDMPSDEFINQVQNNWKDRLQATRNSNSSLETYCHQIVTCTQIALKCVEKDRQKRPDIVTIIDKLNEIETHIGEIKSTDESKDIKCQHQNINLMAGPSHSELDTANVQEKPIEVIEELIVGRTEEKRKIMKSLRKVILEKIVILPIYGIGGIGKTTFARLIYNDPKFEHYSRVWVDVAQKFDLNKIRGSIISQLSRKESQTNEGHVMCSSPTKIKSGKKIFVVLDDLWEDDQLHLQELKDMLYLDDSNITVLVTTRSERVAKRICTNLQPYKILPLTNDMCWDIIKQRSDFDDRDDKEQLMGIGLEIAQKCGGVALAAQSLGFTLRSMNFDQWMELKDCGIWNEPVSKEESLPNHALASLKLSYIYMDPCLKPCFTYCAIFPKGHKIVKNDLVYQWISLGFIRPTKLLSNIQLSEKYIVQLLGLSFFQNSVLTKTSEAYSEKATTFTMHDLVHDLAISLLGNKLLDKSEQEITMGKSKDYQYAVLGDCSMPLGFTSAAELIALHFIDCHNTKLNGDAFAPAASLRVLDLSDCSIHKLPESIGQLKQLRYLNASGIQHQQFPECITKLSHLIFLNLHGSAIEKIPDSIGEMKDLMHLDLSGCGKIKGLPDSFMSLQKLVHLDFSNCSLILSESESLWSLGRLEHLSLSGCRFYGDLAKALSGLTKLQYLDLSQVYWSGTLCTEVQQVLARFRKLRYLDVRGFLDRCKVLGAESVTFIEAISRLSSLEYLNLGSNNFLHNIPESIGNLSKLRALDLSRCANLERLPAAISRIDDMKHLHVAGCNKLDKSTLPLYKNVAVLLPYFVVHAGDSESSSNLCQLEYENPTKLEMSRLENVKSAAEADRIKLVEKHNIKELGLVWTRDAKRFVADDKDVLEKLVPPRTLGRIRLQGYNSAVFPSWMMDIATYVPHLVYLTLEDMPNCSSLPPLGQLRSLKHLRIRRMDTISKIGQDVYGDGGLNKIAFPQHERFLMHEMKCFEHGSMEVALPNLEVLLIEYCPMLRFQSLSPLGLGKKVSIRSSDGVLTFSSSSWVCTGHFVPPSSAATTSLWVESCEAPLHKWGLLHHLPYLKNLTIINCSDLTCSSTDLLRGLPSLMVLSVRDCKSIAALPERLGDLTSLKKLEISNCEGIKALPESIQLLTHLQRLKINGCPQLVQLRCPPSLETLTVKNCKSIVQLLQSLGDHSSLVNLKITDCEGVKALPESIQLLTCLVYLKIKGCPQLVQLRCPPSLESLSVRNCKRIVHLPQRLGDLTSLERVVISDCEGIKAMPESVQQLTCLQRLEINHCPQLVQWCKSVENKMKLAQIKYITLDNSWWH